MAGRYARSSTAGSITRRRLVTAVGATAVSAAFLAACGGSSKKSSSSTAATAAATTAASSAGTSATAASAASAAASGAATEVVQPGQLTAAEKAQAHNTVEEYRLRYHYSKLRNLPGQKQGPKYGGIFRSNVAPPVNWDMLDPISKEGALGWVYNGLVEMPNDDWHDVHRGIRPTPDLATWEQPDATTLVFSIAQGVKWQDRPPVNGRPLTIDDVRLSYEALRKAPYQGPNYHDVKSTEATDAQHLRITFNNPAPYFLNNLLSQSHVVVPPELLGTDASKTQAVGTGPLILKSYKPGQTMDFDKNPSYFKKDARTGTQLPYLDGMSTVNYGDRNSLLAAFHNGQIDQISLAYGLKEPKSLGIINKDGTPADPNVVFQVVSPSTWGMTHVAFKLEKPPWNDVRVRRALSLAFNRQDMVDGLVDGMGAMGSYPLDWTYFKDAKTGQFQEWPWEPGQLGQYQKYDPAQAKQLLAAAGFSSQNPLTFEALGLGADDTLFRQSTHLAVVADWQKTFGDLIKPKFTGLEALAYSRVAQTREYEVYFAWLTGPAYEPDGFLYAQLHSGSSFNFYGVNDPDIDKWTEAQRVETNNDKRQVLWQQVMDRDLDQVYRAFTFHGYKMQARRANLFNVLDVMHAWAPGFRGPAQWGWKLS